MFIGSENLEIRRANLQSDLLVFGCSSAQCWSNKCASNSIRQRQLWLERLLKVAGARGREEASRRLRRGWTANEPAIEPPLKPPWLLAGAPPERAAKARTRWA